MTGADVDEMNIHSIDLVMNCGEAFNVASAFLQSYETRCARPDLLDDGLDDTFVLVRTALLRTVTLRDHAPADAESVPRSVN